MEGATAKLDGKLTVAGLSTGRLANQFANLAGRIAHANPIVGNLASVLGDFAVGGVVTAGVLGGLAAIALAYDKLTESSRKAMEQSDKLIDSLLRSARIRALGVGGEARAAIEDIAKGTAEHGKRAGFLLAAQGVLPFLQGAARGDLEQMGKAATATQEAVNQLGLAIAAANDKAAEGSPKTRELTLRYGELRDAAAKVNDEALKQNRDWWRGYIERTGEAEEATRRLAEQIAVATGTDLRSLLTGPQQTSMVSMPSISMPFEGLSDTQKDSLRQLGVLTDKADENAQMLHDAIWGSAAQLANSVVSALNIGGGGRGSGLGGAIGGTAGFALGFGLGGGPVGGAIGSTIGNIIGSAIGGLFDHHKKAVDTNTQALRGLTQAIVQNTPSGFKVASLRYDATDVGSLGQALRKRARRGGPNPLLVGT